ncbi:hypothetical protein SAMN05444166_5691 [Singulisphaera sp. GP187]|uniref:hypothetical protein n=1 Tax=Singulisphaera sp. GP187 TaxID=1882752 RepID=UPI000928D375|nr:hypothetical protein [Singulisphaera sp. GP187]SIO58471.1 hypothetical protein SAMN05444166_5691 [Singulisphaera sp. GP187]
MTNASKLTAASFDFNGECRPLTIDELDQARFFVKHLDLARGFVDGQFGHADETDEFRAARERYESFEGDERAYLKAAREDRDFLLPDDLQSYAGYSANLYEPGTMERAVWSILRSAEVDVIRLIDALANVAAPTMPGVESDPPRLVLDGRWFSFAFLDEDCDVRDARLIVEDARELAGAY